MSKNVAIIGAGITGLTMGFYLKKAGIPFTIFEKSNRVGGVIQTKQTAGFTYETGPNSGVLSNVEVLHLLDNLQETVKLEIGNESAKKRLIWKGNKWHALPSGLLSAVNTPLFTFSDKLRVLGEPFRKKGTNPNENLAEMVKRRLGNSFLDYAIDPFISGIYAGDPEYLIPRFALPKLYQLEQDYGSFIKGAIKKAKLPKTPDEKRVTKAIFSFEGGLQSLTDVLYKIIGKEAVKCNQQDIKVTLTDNGYQIDKQHFTNVISTVNAHYIPNLFPFLQTQETTAINQLKYAKVIEAGIGFKQWNGMNINAFGGLVPMKEKRDILGVLFMSSIFQNRAPKDGALLTVFIGGTRREELTKLPENQLKEILSKELSQMLQIKDFNPDLFELNYYDKAIAQYGLDSEARLQAIENIEKKHLGLTLAGSIRDGVGIADRIKQATQIVQHIIQSLANISIM